MSAPEPFAAGLPKGMNRMLQQREASLVQPLGLVETPRSRPSVRGVSKPPAAPKGRVAERAEPNALRAASLGLVSLTLHLSVWALLAMAPSPSRAAKKQEAQSQNLVEFTLVGADRLGNERGEEQAIETASAVPTPKVKAVQRVDVHRPEPLPSAAEEAPAADKVITADATSEAAEKVASAPSASAGAATGSGEGTSGRGQAQQDGVAQGATAARGAQSVGDLQGLVRGWMQRVGRTLMERAIHDYPAEAQRARLEGVVLISFLVDAQGRMSNIEIKRSSGHRLLDRAALASLKAVTKVPSPPAALVAMAKPITVPIAYRIQ